jgi:hypothetical protein
LLFLQFGIMGVRWLNWEFAHESCQRQTRRQTSQGFAADKAVRRLRATVHVA